MKRLSGNFRYTCTAIALIALAGLAACGDDGADAPAEPGDAPATAVDAPVDPTEVLEREVAGDFLAYAEVDGKLVRGYFAYPADMIEPLPAVLFIHDWFGIDEEMRAVAYRIASKGYVVLAVDLFGGEMAENAAGARQLLVQLLNAPDNARSNIGQAYDFLTTTVGSPTIAAVGFGSGGVWALNTALMYPEALDAVVNIHGQTLRDAEQLSTLSMPVLGIYGAADRSMPLDEVREFGSLMQSVGVPGQVRLYPEAGRGFMLSGRPTYSAGQASSAWREIDTFLAESLAAN
ncbi:MAG: dienelactone hydrolase family protein [Pseudomonadota bacterium]